MAYTGVNSGVQTSVTQLAANQMPSIDKILYLLEPYQTPLLQHLFFDKKIGKKAEVVYSENGRFDWFEDELFPHQDVVQTDISISAATTLTITWASLTNPSMFNLNDIVLIESTEEAGYVSTINSSTSIVLTKLSGSFTAGTATAGSYLKVIGSLNFEYGTPRTGMFTQEINKFNYLTEFKETVSTSGRRQAGRTYTDGKTHREQVQKKILEMKAQIERNFWFSPTAVSTSSGNYRATVGQGFIGRVTTNKVPYTGVLTEAAFDEFLAQCFTAKGSSNKKMAFVGATTLSEINKFIKDKYELTDNPTKVYGVDVREYITPFGSLSLTWNPLMDGKYASQLFLMDMDNGVKLRYMNNDLKGSRKFRVEDNVETPGTDGTSSQILADVGIQIPNEETHGILYKAA